MGMITKTVTGDAEALKLVKNSKQAPLDPKGGTKYATYRGSAAPRPAGAVNNQRGKYGVKVTPGWVDQAPVEQDISLANKVASEHLVAGTGPKAGKIKKVFVADNAQPIDKGMGGVVYGPKTNKFGNK